MSTITKFDPSIPPPPYQETPTDIPSAPTPTPSNNKPAFRFPQDFGIYHASSSFSDLCIAQSASSSPQFYISTHSSFSTEPSVVLHSSSSPSSSPLATAQFRTFSSTMDITLVTPSQAPKKFTLSRDGPFQSNYIFDFPVGNATQRFEWKPSRGEEVQALQGRSRGLKLVRGGTGMGKGEVVAAWTGPNSGTRKKGKLRFMARGNGLGEEWELMAVICIAAMAERARRTKGRGGGGVVAGGGGGGC